MVILITCKNEEDPLKIKGARVFTTISILHLMRDICCHGNQSYDPIWPKTHCSLSPDQMMLQIKFDCVLPTGLSDVHV